MIFTSLLATIIAFIGAIFDMLNIPTVTALPLVDSYLVTGRGYLEWFIVYFPPIGTMLAGFLVVVSFKVLIFTLRLFRIVR